MRYYSRFPRGIPHQKVDHPRVTHPYATVLRDCSPFSFDLHVLGAPPALILSRDQTLVGSCAIQPSPAKWQTLRVFRSGLLRVLTSSSLLHPTRLSMICAILP